MAATETDSEPLRLLVGGRYLQQGQDGRQALSAGDHRGHRPGAQGTAGGGRRLP